MEGGTLQQLQNLIGWRNISMSTDVTGHVNEVEVFIKLVVRCYLIMSGLHYFSMSSLTDKPHSNVFPTNYRISIPLAKRKTIFLITCLLSLIDTSFLESSIPRSYKKDYSHNQRKFGKILTCTALHVLLAINHIPHIHKNLHIDHYTGELELVW